MKKYYMTLGILQTFTALGAIPAGIGFLLDTSGSLMGASTEILSDSPLHSFLLPGLFLVFINGFANLAGAFFSFRGKKNAGLIGLVLGIILCLWIVIQIRWITLSSFLQPLFLVIGLINIFLSIKIQRTDPH